MKAASVELSLAVPQEPQRTIDYNTSNFHEVLTTPNARHTTGSYFGADRYYSCDLYQGNNVTLRKSPEFIIAAFQMGGTSAMYALLHKHPNVFGLSPNPEPHFFIIEASSEPRSMPSVNIDKLIVLFGLHLRRALVQMTCHLRKPADYLIVPSVPEKISKICFWKPKIIVSLRNPVDRAYSFYQMKTLGRNISIPSSEE